MTHLSSCCKAPVEENFVVQDGAGWLNECTRCKKYCTIYEANVEMELQHCQVCGQMTNHANGKCLKCLRIIPKNAILEHAETPQSAVEGIVGRFDEKYKKSGTRLSFLAKGARDEIKDFLRSEISTLMQEVGECIGKDQELQHPFCMVNGGCGSCEIIITRNNEKARIRSALEKRGLIIKK